jgi:hypothetical protein
MTEAPEIFDDKGRFVGVPDSIYRKWTDNMRAAYDDVKRDALACEAIERELHEAVQDVKADARAIGELEAIERTLPRVTHTDVVREWIESQRRLN